MPACCCRLDICGQRRWELRGGRSALGMETHGCCCWLCCWLRPCLRLCLCSCLRICVPPATPHHCPPPLLPLPPSCSLLRLHLRLPGRADGDGVAVRLPTRSAPALGGVPEQVLPRVRGRAGQRRGWRGVVTCVWVDRRMGALVGTDKGSREGVALLGGTGRGQGLLSPDWRPALQTPSARLTLSAAAQQQCS
jgi:hypothetical protein